MGEAVPEKMRAWEITKPGKIDGEKSPLKYTYKKVPSPGADEVLVKVLTCGVCHTDLHVTEGDLPVHKNDLTPGHEIIGEVVANGNNAHRFRIGERIGIPWLRQTCGVCKYCRSGRENLCPFSQYTGWDHDGGYEEYTTVPEGFAYEIPKSFNDYEAAPLLCAGIIGYRAFERAAIPAGGRLGIYGFGGSAHITAQLAIDSGMEVHVFTRGADAKRFALSLGAKSVNNTYDHSPVPLDSSIIFAPVGEAVPNALESLAPGGTLALAGIHMSDIPKMSYDEHLFHEKNLTSVESNTRRDGEEFLTLADRLRIVPDVSVFPLNEADQALKRVKKGDLKGACILRVGTKQ